MHLRGHSPWARGPRCDQGTPALDPAQKDREGEVPPRWALTWRANQSLPLPKRSLLSRSCCGVVLGFPHADQEQGLRSRPEAGNTRAAQDLVGTGEKLPHALLKKYKNKTQT